MAFNPLSLFAARTFNGFAPRQKPKAMFVPLDFSAASGSNGAPIPIDLELVETEAWLEFVQAVFIDNTLTDKVFTLSATISQHTLTLSGGKQAYLPILAPEKAKFIATLSAADTHLIKVQFLNFPVPAIVW